MEAMDDMLEKAGVDELIRVTGPSQVDKSLVPRKIISCFPQCLPLLCLRCLPTVSFCPSHLSVCPVTTGDSPLELLFIFI